MARSGMALAAVVFAMVVVGVMSASTPSSNCESAQMKLVPCLTYVTGSDSKPPTECCSGLKDLNTNNPTCLCQLITQLNSTSSGSSNVNVAKVLALPRDCSVTLITSDCPALANLPLAPPVAGSSVTGPAAAPALTNDVSRLLHTSWVATLAVAAAGIASIF
ncbi:non-specific lipid transfer protein GPI-anchored 14 [Physcomitrium patens]|uniref:Bifunctional inhibitor/plant lipid transfer protein/seed storage helical domain-containing protein n=1 Tax=Physcomitrium patens TaxID=3218 RepID=A0A2K1JXR9_PHYPA|nr:non-specific lipid-transfer protein 3-like [Physcomitrium patens]XP_024386510.1 non-specific lipid-transfer protein 3-like [Physcomitrium patens]XP_024386511.1 non-specific lipid-transfer protein 3-like [Physcomitrium patens]XP_024386512.1 non-specific lipid-transfer protein 3-like [Physcomitrium patens]XP_024386513.1 non-specific lipid-transfer protein 3-like [Physcomitrium patens]PNR46309.1 hypothetical protein PHYPA_013428 [Physcomitrium patens]|eukprot:XP_024386509.1 non-specific lipid-transfer protein 3-like [Physcomitrella patens]